MKSSNHKIGDIVQYLYNEQWVGTVIDIQPKSYVFRRKKYEYWSLSVELICTKDGRPHKANKILVRNAWTLRKTSLPERYNGECPFLHKTERNSAK